MQKTELAPQFSVITKSTHLFSLYSEWHQRKDNIALAVVLEIMDNGSEG